MGSYIPSPYIIAKRMAAVIMITVITVTVNIAKFSIAAVIIVNRQRDHEFVIIAPIYR